MIDIEASAHLGPRESAEAARLSALAEALGVEPIELDEAVHEAAARYASEACNRTGAVDNDEAAHAIYDEAGRQAADIKNAGLRSQITYLVAQFGDEAEQIIREAACDG